MNIADALRSVEKKLSDLNEIQNQIKERKTVKDKRSAVTEEIDRLEGIEKRLNKVEETKGKTSHKLQTILEDVSMLSKKVENISVVISKFKPKEASEVSSKFSHGDLSKGDEKCIRETVPTNDQSRETKRATEDVSSTEQNVLQQTKEDCSKPDIVKNDDKQTNSRSQRSPQCTGLHANSDSCQHVNTLNRLKSDTVPVKKAISRPKVKRLESGFKLSNTYQHLDNRIYNRSKKTGYEGELSDPVVETADYECVSTPNITVNIEKQSRRSTEQNMHSTRKHTGVMTMAQMVERDFNHKQNVHSYEEWMHIAAQSKMEVALHHFMTTDKTSSKGHKYMLLLDTSESMKGEKFDLMIRTVTEYLNGLQLGYLNHGVQDKVGLAYFGEETKLISGPHTDYGELKTELGKLKPAGPSPLAAGLLMAFSGITHLNPTTISKHDFHTYMIVFTDGLPTRVEALNEEDRDSSSALVLTNLVRDEELDTTIAGIARGGFRIHCVPFGSYSTDIVRRIVRKTNGKLIPPEQIHRLCVHTKVLYHASKIAHVLESSTELNKSIVKTEVLTTVEPQELDKYDDITDNVMLLLDPVTRYGGKFKKPNCQSLQLGTRVRRGPNWRSKNQDSGMAGTVIGEDNEGLIWVEWDSGNRNRYHYDENIKTFDIKVVNEPRRLIDELIAVGCKVQRGKDWRYKDQDGGRGSIGTVLRVELNGKVVVHWDHGKLGIYKFAHENLFEVEVCGRGRIRHSSELIEAEDNQIFTQDLPLILPPHSGKNMKPVTATWQYQDKDGQWTSYETDTNIKIERAFSRHSSGKCIVEIEKTIYVVLFSKMIQENHTDKTTVPVQRIDQSAEEADLISDQSAEEADDQKE